MGWIQACLEMLMGTLDFPNTEQWNMGRWDMTAWQYTWLWEGLFPLDLTSVAISVLMFSKEINSDNTHYKSRSCTQFNYNKQRNKNILFRKSMCWAKLWPFPNRQEAYSSPLPTSPSSFFLQGRNFQEGDSFFLEALVIRSSVCKHIRQEIGTWSSLG